MVKHLQKYHGLGHSEVGHRRWNCVCHYVHLHTAKVRGATSTAAFPRFSCLKDEVISSCQTGHQLDVLEQQPLQSLHLNSIENLYRKVDVASGDNQAHAD